MQSATTHPWITSTLDLRQAPPNFWMLLSDACAKCEFIADMPIPPDDKTDLIRTLFERSALASAAIEGNTLTAEEVTLLANGELELPTSKEYLGIEVLNILNSYEEVSGRIHNGQHHPSNAEWIKRLHAIILEGLELGENITPGEIRSIEVGVGRYLCPPAAECERLVEQLGEWLDEMYDERLNPPNLALPILKAILAHLYLIWIHPFADSNGRTARLLEHHIMLAGGVPETATHLLSDFYNKTRSNYYRRLEASSKSLNGVTGFLLYALQGFVDELSKQIERLLKSVQQHMWAGYIRENFQTNIDPTSKRRIILARNLPAKPIQRKQLLTSNREIALTYSNKSAQTFTRDLNALKQMGLVEQTSEGVRSKIETLMLHSSI